MGLSLQRVSFKEWLEGIPLEARRYFLNELTQHLGRRPNGNWRVQENEWERVGSYSSFGIFRICLEYISRRDPIEEYDESWEPEREAIHQFRNRWTAASLEVKGNQHLLDVGDTDTLFIPMAFKTPWEWNERWVASLPEARLALEDFAQAIQFSLDDPEEAEEVEGKWNAVATAKNVASILYRFFGRAGNGCVEFS